MPKTLAAKQRGSIRRLWTKQLGLGWRRGRSRNQRRMGHPWSRSSFQTTMNKKAPDPPAHRRPSSAWPRSSTEKLDAVESSPQEHSVAAAGPEAGVHRWRLFVADLATPSPQRESSTLIAPTKAGGHLPLHRLPHAHKASTHPGLPLPKDPPLPHVSCLGLEVQRSGHTATGEALVERLAEFFKAIG